MDAPASTPQTRSALNSRNEPSTVLLLGNPNVGKTTLYNALTGQNERVGNYAGITVERRASRVNAAQIEPFDLVDVPGTYSLSARSFEEQIALDSALGLNGNPTPALAVVLVDAGQLARNLYLVLQLVEFQVPLVLALTMLDEAEPAPIPELVGRLFSVPCVGVNPKTRSGVPALLELIETALRAPKRGDVNVRYPAEVQREIDRVASALPSALRRNVERDRAFAAWALLSVEPNDELSIPAEVREACRSVRADNERQGRDLDLAIIDARYRRIEQTLPSVYPQATPSAPRVSWTERADRVLLHPVYGFALFLAFMLVIFQSLFSWADPAISLIEQGVAFVSEQAASRLPEGFFSDLLVQGILGGVGNVIVFVPQIALLFLFVSVLEDSGYMARIAYLMDRVLRSVGLHGKAFVPMLSGMACAVPAIMATRTMEQRRDRLLTMLVVPLMTCSARLPVYALVISALFPPSAGWFPTQAFLLVFMYLFSTVTTLIAAKVLGRTLIRGARVPLILELPRYRWPSPASTARSVWLRSKQFLVEAGTVILGFTVAMWLLLSYPKPPTSEPVAALNPVVQVHGSAASDVNTMPPAPPHTQPSAIEYSFAGRFGKALAPVMAPLGFDWKLTVGILGAFSAREVFVSTLGLVFGLDDQGDNAAPLRDSLRAETRANGTSAYPPLVGLSLLIFFALACQCMSTLAVVKRETQSWRWPLFMFSYMTVLAYASSFLVYQTGRLLGFAG